MSKINEIKKRSKSGHEVTLSTPIPADGAEILELVKTIFKQSRHLLTSIDDFNYTVAQEEQMVKDHLDHPDKVIIVPKVKGKIVGMMNFVCGHKRRIAHQGEFGMSVHPDFQGQGIGRLMLEELINWAKLNQNIETIRLKVHSQNKNAIALYKSLNFKEEGREIKGIKFEDGNYDDVFIMALEVKKPLAFL